MKVKKHSKIITALSIAIGISFAIGFGYYNKAVAKEQITTAVSVNGEGVKPLKPIIIDVADQGVVKKWLQPTHLITRYEIKNEGKEPLTIKVDAVNFTSNVIVESGSPGFEKPSAEYVTTLNPGKSIRLKVRVSLSDTNLIQSKQYLGMLRVLNQQNGLQLGNSSVYAINSTVQPPHEKTLATPAVQHEGHTKNE
ncbi:hypothetical protein [Pelosinus sp. UFO1]|jgi:hypothetical protein|uniref:hypothetical protein n=1 Tax=Pelosinus sp. UFO1 TaxID=484770 RepID=UPI0004D14A56|nr:hypothetical protein [Pelosinus sp. UFO1]AIF52396.1 hypothetical protein UFO1_2853 [Pelosinus sp. UFO1]